MKVDQLILELEEVAKQLGISIRYEKGDFEGGYCILRDTKMLIVNRRVQPQKKAAVLALGLNDMGLDNMYLKPALREFIEDEVVKAQREARQV
ncbi:MAG TPA: hypothetical protein VGB89_15325 [Bacteroidota bacterium]